MSDRELSIEIITVAGFVIVMTENSGPRISEEIDLHIQAILDYEEIWNGAGPLYVRR